jgi:hypothetical protein
MRGTLEQCTTPAWIKDRSMSLIATPPPIPVIALGDDDGARRLRFRLWQLLGTAGTVLITTWFCTLGVFPAILAIMVAKHVLVAILIMGLDEARKQKA